MIKEFKEFISKGNVVDLAVAVIIGAAFAGIVKAFTEGMLMPVISAIGGEKSFDELHFTVNSSDFKWGSVLTATLNFLIVAFAMFIVVKAMNKAHGLRRTKEEETVDEITELDVLTEIRDLLVAQNNRAG